MSSEKTPPTNGKASGGIFETLGTLGRKKKLREGLSFPFHPQVYIPVFFFAAGEALGILEEGKLAIDANAQHPVFDTSPEDYVLGL